MQRSQTFCPLPWSSLAVQPYGVSLCCASLDDVHVGNESLIQTFLGERMRSIRQQLLAGKWPTECRDCQTREQAGLESYRRQLSAWPIFQDVLRDDHLCAEAGQPLFLELADDHVCNLKCRMCRPQYSTKWREDLAELRKSRMLGDWFFDERPPAKGLQLDPKDSEFRSLQLIMLKGGEPMLSRSHLEFLSGLAAIGVAQNVTLQMVTNGTVLPAPYVDVMREFKKVEITISVDAVDPLFQYIRSGRFTTVEIKRNMDLLSSRGLYFSILTAFQVYNMLALDRLIEEFSPWTQDFSWVDVVNDGLSAHTAPDPLRVEAVTRIDRIPRQKLSPYSHKRLDTLAQQLTIGRFDAQQWRHFKRYTLELDRIRHESIFDAAPEIAAYLDYQE